MTKCHLRSAGEIGSGNEYAEWVRAQNESYEREAAWRLQEAGYETAYIGKWHMGEDDDQQRPGFDFWMSHKGQGNYWDNEFNFNGTRRTIQGYYTTVVTDAAVDWLTRPHSKPWLLVLGHKAPHGGPIVPEPKFEHAFDTQTVVRPINADNYKATQGKPAWLETSYPTWHGSGGPLYGLKEYDRARMP